MVLLFQAMKTAAYFRHAALVTALHWYDSERWLREMMAHIRFVDNVYQPWF
jgi:hypothetical protein